MCIIWLYSKTKISLMEPSFLKGEEIRDGVLLWDKFFLLVAKPKLLCLTAVLIE